MKVRTFHNIMAGAVSVIPLSMMLSLLYVGYVEAFTRCTCDSPGGYGSGTPNEQGSNRYTCDDGSSGYCSADAECYSWSFPKGDWNC